MSWFSKDDYVRTPYRRRRAANYQTLVASLLICLAVLILALLALLVLVPARRQLPDPTSWELAVVNEQSPLSDELSVTVLALPEAYTEDTVYFDARAYDALCKMLTDAVELGYTPIVTGGYETREEASARFRAEQKRLRTSGFSAAEAYRLALENVPLPGVSEYRLGLTVALSCDENVVDFENTQVYAWLTDHAHEYGFVQRSDKTPHVWRYVGTDAARQMTKRGYDLEEYLDYIHAEIAKQQND